MTRKKAPATEPCPFILAEKREPPVDLVCGAPGMRRHRGFCQTHVEELGREMLYRDRAVHMIARKLRREWLALQAGKA
jgi:hypothetical protein